MTRGDPSGSGPSTSTPLVAATTTTQQLLVTSVGNVPIMSNCPTTGVVSMDISEVMNQEQEHQQSATCQFAVASDKGSISSSCAASPNHDEGKDMENSQDSTQTRMDEEIDDFINVQPERNQGDREEEESKTENRQPEVVDVQEDQESSNTPNNQEEHKDSKDSGADAEFEEGADTSLDVTTDQQENQSQVNEPVKVINKQATENVTKNRKAPITTQEMLDVLETSDKEDEDEEEEEEDNDAEVEDRTETGRGTPDVQCPKAVVCLDKLDPSKTPVKLTPVKNNSVLKTPPKNKPPADAPSKSKTPVIPSKSKTSSETSSKNKASSETPSKSKTPSEVPSKNKPSLKTPAKNNSPSDSETSSVSSSTKSLSRKSSSAMPLSKKTGTTKTPSKDSTPIKTSSKNSSEKTSMNPPPAKTSSNAKPPRRGSVTPTPSDDEGTSSSKSRGKKRPLSLEDGAEKIFGTKKLKDIVRSSPRESFSTPVSKKSKKKVFKIGNRYLTESSSSDNDSDKDSDVHFTDCTADDGGDSDY